MQTAVRQQGKIKKGNVVKIKGLEISWNGDIWIEVKNGWLPVVVKGKYRVERA